MTSVHHDDATGQTGFQFTRASGGCDCPIHRDGEPITAPLGLRFAERVQIETIPQHVAGAIYREARRVPRGLTSGVKPTIPNLSMIIHTITTSEYVE
jgi:hypothetical protein